jgi:hypothetical protein
MNNKLTLVLASSLIFLGVTLKAQAVEPGHSIGYVVSGTVTLTKGKGELPKDLDDIYLGRDTQMPANKVIPVTGTYVPGYTFVRVYEYLPETKTQIEGEKYFFDIPVAPEAFSTTKRGVFKRSNTLITAYFTTNEGILNNGLDDDTNNSIHRIYKKKFIKPAKPKNPIKKFKKKLRKIAVNKFKAGVTKSITDFGAMLSVPRVVVKNIDGTKGTIVGKFDRDRSPAKGRFSLEFSKKVTYEVPKIETKIKPPFTLFTDQELQDLLNALKETFGDK